MAVALLACSGKVSGSGGGGGSATGGGVATGGGSAMGGGGTATGGGGSATGGGGTGGGGATGGGAGTGGGTGVPIDGGTCLMPNPAFTALEQTLVNLDAGTWFVAPSSKLRAVCPSSGTMGDCANVIDAWSGGAWDPVHNQMLIFGGGHVDYSGNEVYAFDLATLSWSRLTNPSDPAGKDQDPLPDGQPISRHSYDGLQYETHSNVLFDWGGSEWGMGGGTTVTWQFDPAAKTWTDRAPAEPTTPNCCSHGTAYDPAGKRVWLHQSNALYSYDDSANAWSDVIDFGQPPLWPRYENYGDKTGTVDTSRRLLWFFGSRLYLVFDLDAGMPVTDSWVTTGGTTFDNTPDVGGHSEEVIMTGGAELITAQGPGLDYDPVADALAGWVGGGPWVLDLKSKSWSQQSGAGAPVNTAQHGTFGRWRYVSRVNAFILVNSVDDDVYFFKLTPRCGN